MRPGPLEPAAAVARRARRAARTRADDPAFADACHRGHGRQPAAAAPARCARWRPRACRPTPRTPRPCGRSARAPSRARCCCAWRGSTRRRSRVARAVAVLGESADLARRRARSPGSTSAPWPRRPTRARGGRDPAARRRRSASSTRWCATPSTTSCRPAERELAHARAAARAATSSARRTTPSPRSSCSRPRAATAAVVERLRERPPGARRRGAAESAVAYLPRALDEPPHADARPQLLLRARPRRGADQRARRRASTCARPATGSPTPRSARSPPASLARARAVHRVGAGRGRARWPCAARASCRRRWPTSAGSSRPWPTSRSSSALDRGELADAAALARRAGGRACAAPGARMLAGLAAWDATQQGGPADACAALALRSLADGELLAVDNGLLSIAPLDARRSADRDEVLDGLGRRARRRAPARLAVQHDRRRTCGSARRSCMRGALLEAEADAAPGAARTSPPGATSAACATAAASWPGR